MTPKRPKTNPFQTTFLTLLFHWAFAVSAVEFEKLGSAIAKTLGTKEAFREKASLGGVTHDIFFSKAKNGKPAQFAVVQKKIYEPNCTHTWVIGVNAKTLKVTGIRVVEMSCPHAFPTRSASFLDQFKGKGIAQLATLKSETRTIAKATGSCLLTADAVVTAISAAKAQPTQ